MRAIYASSYRTTVEKLDSLYDAESKRPLSLRYSDYRKSSKISFPFFSTPPKTSDEYLDKCSAILNAFNEGCEINSFVDKLFDYSDQFLAHRMKTVEIYILSTSRSLSLLYPREIALEKEFLEVSKVLLDNPLSSLEKAKILAATVFQKKEEGFVRLRMDLIEIQTPKPEDMSIPDLSDDVSFNSIELIDARLDRIERILKELVDTEIVFGQRLAALLNNPIFKLNSHYREYEILLTASNCLVVALRVGNDEKEKFISCLKAFSSKQSHPYFLSFKKPIQLSDEVTKWMAQAKIIDQLDASDILIAPMQRVTKIKLLLETLLSTLNVGPGKTALEARLNHVKSWLALYNLL